MLSSLTSYECARWDKTLVFALTVSSPRAQVEDGTAGPGWQEPEPHLLELQVIVAGRTNNSVHLAYLDSLGEGQIQLRLVPRNAKRKALQHPAEIGVSYLLFEFAAAHGECLILIGSLFAIRASDSCGDAKLTFAIHHIDDNVASGTANGEVSRGVSDLQVAQVDFVEKARKLRLPETYLLRSWIEIEAKARLQ